ncbi:hypothetical protein HG430_004545 [Candidatus Gracilibacteria bacterium]|nr:hypothetical protein [Candidatus Gracilibacteria bacterium]
MGDYLICSLKTSKILEVYFIYFVDIIRTGIYYVDLSINFFLSHSFISPLFVSFESILDLDSLGIFLSYFIWVVLFLLVGITIDLLLYFLGKYLGKYLKFQYESKKLFYIFLRFIPIIGIFGVFIGALLSKEFNYKKDFLKIFAGNILFIIFNISFWVALKQFCGPILEL